jgi:ribosomal protein L35
MPKMKTHRGAAKRFKKTGSGKLKRANAFKSHLLTGKSSKRKRNLRKTSYVSVAQEKNMKKLLPYL